MTSNQPEENSTNAYKLINSQENKKSTFNDEGEVSVSISKYEGNIFGARKLLIKKRRNQFYWINQLEEEIVQKNLKKT